MIHQFTTYVWLMIDNKEESYISRNSMNIELLLKLYGIED